MAWKNLSLQNALEGAATAAQRFPLTLLSALLGTVISYRLLNLEGNIEDGNNFLPKLLIFSWLGLILFFDLELIAERYAFPQKKRWLVFAGGLAALVGYYLYLPETLYNSDGLVRHLLQLFLFGLGLHLLASFAPYFNPKTEHGFWQFNEKLFLRFLTATLYSGVLFVGICVALVAIQQLFQVHFDGKIFARLWLFMAGIFHPWFFLAGVPQNLKNLEAETTYPKGLKVFTQFVLLPLVTVYLLILYMYLGKIVVEWEWPRGWVSYLVLSFSLVGIFSLLLIHPVRNTQGNSWINTYAKGFYLALFPLLILLALAIWRRVSEYGITEERYFVLLLAAWLLAVALYFLFSRRKNIKFIPVTLCFLAFLAGCGPWGAFAVSRRSQVGRLEHYFQKNGMFSGGKLQPPRKRISQKDAREIFSILYYLADKHDFKTIQPWFNPQLDSVYARYSNAKQRHHRAIAKDIIRVLQLNPLLYYVETDSATVVVSQADNMPPEPILREFGFFGAENAPVHTSGFDYLVSFRFYAGGDHRQVFPLGSRTLEVSSQSNAQALKPRLYFKWDQRDTSSLDLRPMIRKLLKENVTQPEKSVLTESVQVGKTRLRLYFKSTKGILRGKKPELNVLEVQALVKLPPDSGS